MDSRIVSDCVFEGLTFIMIGPGVFERNTLDTADFFHRVTELKEF